MWRLIFILPFISFTSEISEEREIDQFAVIERHNDYRRDLGLNDLQYSEECAQKAQLWAEHLAKKNRGLKHSKFDGYGENIAWNSIEMSESETVDMWGEEIEKFNKRRRKFTYATGHYSQIVWKNTKFVGTGMAVAKDGSEYWVCNYYPTGNVIGEKAY